MDEKKGHKQKMTKGKGLTIAIYAICLILGAIALWQYIEKQQFTIKATDSVNLNSFVAEKEIKQKDQKFEVTLSDYEFTQLLAETLKGEKLGKFTIENVLWKEKRLNLELVNGKTTHSYVANAKFEIQDEKLLMKLSNIRMGTLNSHIAGKLMWTVDKLPKKVQLPIYMDNEYIYISIIKSDSDNKVILTLAYDDKSLAKRMSIYKDGIDLAKLQLQKKRNDVEEIALLIQQEKYSTENKKQFVSYVSQGEEALTDLALIFNEQTTRTFLNDFKDLYAKRINVERIVQRSKSDLEHNLEAYHLQFASSTLKYLYKHPDYKLLDGEIVVDGQVVTAATIFFSNNLAEKYKTTLSVKEDVIVANYEVGEQTLSKTIIRKGWVE